MSVVDLQKKALDLLARREHSRQELQRKLSRLDADSAEIAAALDALEARGWLSDARFAAAYVRANAARFGRFRLEQALRELGIADALIREALDNLPEDDTELLRARTVWQKRFRERPRDEQERARQARFLQSRGFAYEVIRKVIAGLEDE
ncbi:recombination regulator RecX [Chitinimonas taiwanensis]|uniref:Regulatory protein RecX n=1 Tax=Chitinimonas taiwanensis DSM 18899 TaxID=1121279 RepID=A0A1K2H763_9NEIS|nr:recombination regulator RecX [Chitinimonas taiwanensis]SFZ72259.1 regulatory protein [Chitinimonas taiwanensis DSM 18899]